jgi:hypothetical protein
MRRRCSTTSCCATFIHSSTPCAVTAAAAAAAAPLTVWWWWWATVARGWRRWRRRSVQVRRRWRPPKAAPPHACCQRRVWPAWPLQCRVLAQVHTQQLHRLHHLRMCKTHQRHTQMSLPGLGRRCSQLLLLQLSDLPASQHKQLRATHSCPSQRSDSGMVNTCNSNRFLPKPSNKG